MAEEMYTNMWKLRAHVHGDECDATLSEISSLNYFNLMFDKTQIQFLAASRAVMIRL